MCGLNQQKNKRQIMSAKNKLWLFGMWKDQPNFFYWHILAAHLYYSVYTMHTMHTMHNAQWTQCTQWQTVILKSTGLPLCTGPFIIWGTVDSEGLYYNGAWEYNYPIPLFILWMLSNIVARLVFRFV